MYKVMVVDDEQWGRKAIIKLFAELTDTVEVVAEAKHGEEALQLIQINKPHIIVTDMNMPVMEGKEFLENLFSLHKEIKVIVISGYSEFEYLKAALTYQVCDYVLKPVSIIDLNKAITKAIEGLEKDGNLRQQQYHAISARKLKREVFLQHVTNQRIVNHSDIARQVAEFEIAHSFNSYRMVILTSRQFREVTESKYHGNVDLFMFSLENILSEIIKSDIPLIYRADDWMKLCVILPSADYDIVRIKQILTEFQQAVHFALKVDIVAGISRKFEGLEILPVAFDEALTGLWLNKFQGSGLSASMADTKAAVSHVEILTSFDLKILKQAVVNKNKKEVHHALEHFISKITLNKDILIQDVHYEYSRLGETIASGMKEIAISNRAVFDYHVQHIMNQEELILNIHKMNTLIEETFLHFGGQDSSFPVQEIVDFLGKHYFEELSLVDIATRFHIEPSYFSKLFKAVTNENFIEYITRLRLEKACDFLISTERKVNEIAELIGYENQRYFSQVFKKFTGQTPSEYRELHETTKSITKK